MSSRSKNTIWIILGGLIIIVVAVMSRKGITPDKTYTVKRQTFESVITVKGEIQGKNAVFISYPDDLKHRDIRIGDFQIKDLIEEGSLVKKGDWVATLDIDNINQQIEYNNDDLERRLAELNDQINDSAIQLTQLREELKELRFDLEYRKLDLEQAKYESPAYQRKIRVAFNKTLRQIEKKRRDYELRRLNLAVRTKRREDQYNFAIHRDTLLKKALVAATITAPRDGMVMYARTNWGRKIRKGDYVSQWNPAIASIPDLTSLVSETYVEEIDITKLKSDDSVSVTVDAIPGKVYTGEVYKIGNIGQELPGFESKVFNVLIEILNSDENLKPAMTSNNDIVLNSRKDVLTIPRASLFADNNGPFVYLKKAGEVFRQPVTAGLENDDAVIIESGLEENDEILLEQPDKPENIALYNQIASGE